MIRATICVHMAFAACAAGQQRLYLAWSDQVVLGQASYAYGLASGADGDVYFAGVYSDPNPTTRSFFARYTPSGHRVWLRSALVPSLLRLLPGSNGEIIATGAAGPSGVNLWMGRYDGQGVLLGQGIGSIGYGFGAAHDSAGGVFIVGPSGNDIVLARFGADAQQSCSQIFGGELFDTAAAAVEDGSGGVYIAAHTLEGNFGGPPAGHMDAIVDRRDAAGNRVWIRRFGGTGADEVNAAARHPSGCYVAGRTSANLAGPSFGSYDGWVARYLETGERAWIRQFGTQSFDEVWTAAPDDAGGVWLAGVTGGGLGGPNGGAGDGFVVRFNATDDHSGFLQFGGAGTQWPRAILPDSAGGVYVAMHFQIGGGSTAVLSRFTCYANCDTSTTAPFVNVADFTCFLQRFAAGESYANCDGSTTPPTLNVADFTCFLQAFAAGCP